MALVGHVKIINLFLVQSVLEGNLQCNLKTVIGSAFELVDGAGASVGGELDCLQRLWEPLERVEKPQEMPARSVGVFAFDFLGHPRVVQPIFIRFQDVNRAKTENQEDEDPNSTANWSLGRNELWK